MATIKIPDSGSNNSGDFLNIKDKYKSNSEERKHVEKVVQGEVVNKKPGLGKKFASLFFSDDVDNVKEYLLFDVFIPAIKNTFSDLVSNGIQMMLFGTTKGAHRQGGQVYRDYNSISRNNSWNSPRNNMDNNRNRPNLNDVILSSRNDAEEVLSSLRELVADYGSASISDFYQLVGITGDFTDDNWGWYDLSTAGVRWVRDGYQIVLPRAIWLKQ